MCPFLWAHAASQNITKRLEWIKDSAGFMPLETPMKVAQRMKFEVENYRKMIYSRFPVQSSVDESEWVGSICGVYYIQ